MKPNIAELERRYQTLFKEFQAGAIDEGTFIGQVDELQFQDEWGRYWMIGAQSGAWHYYDGQTWHQADPNEADKLPVIDDQGRYWQRGAKSGDWYYYEPETGEWVKPGQGEPAAPGQPQAAHETYQYAPATASEPVDSRPAPAQQPYPYTPTAAPGPADHGDAQLFQDDDGRYWSIGTKSGQWYFYDDEGWHPAHEFEARVIARAPHGPAYPPQAPTFVNTAQPLYPASSGTGQMGYPYPPQQAAMYSQPAPAPQAPQPPAQPAPKTGAQAADEAIPSPPQSAGQPGSWYYFDGKQWMQYATNEPAKGTPPDPNLILDQETSQPQPKPEAKAEPIVAEFIEAEEESPVEVVDVEVITVYEAEPDPAPEPQPPAPTTAEPKADPTPPWQDVTKPVPKPAASATPQPASSRPAASPLSEHEVVPRRSKDTVEMEPVQRSSTPDDTRVPPRRTPTSSNKVVTPRHRPDTTQVPRVVLPTGPTSGASPAAARVSRASSPTAPIPAQQRRARENTLPMEPAAAPPPQRPAETEADETRHRQITQSMPAVSRAPAPPAPDTGQPRVTEQTQPQPSPAKAAPASKPVKPTPPPAQQEEKDGYTLGDILRAFPSTVWTGVAGVAVLLIFAVLIIAGFMYGGNLFGASSVAAVQSPTPTLFAGPPDSTPTPGPTPTSNAGVPVGTPTKAAMTTFSSADLKITLEHPEDWDISDEDSLAIFAPSSDGLEQDTFAGISMRIGLADEENTSISDLLAEVLAKFPSSAETLNEGTISIASQTWTSTQIRFEDENLGGQGIATLAVTSKDGAGYYLIALAPAGEWNSVQPVFQEMINSFRFGVERVVAQVTPSRTPQATRATGTPAATDEADEEDEQSATPAAQADEEEAAEATSTPTRRPSPTPSPTPEASPTPLVYAIQPGDTLLEVATQFGVDLDLLTSENGITDPSTLQIGQELIIPFTAEELAAYNAQQGGGSAAPSTASTADEDEAETAAAEDTAETSQADDDEDAATTVASRPTAAPPATATPAAQPASGRIVYPAFNNGTGVYDVWMVDLATGEQTPIVSAASQPAFNKDGSLLAYRSWERSTRGIFYRDFIGGRSDMATRFVEDALPSWSPDGVSFAFSSRKEGDRVPRIYIGNQQGDEAFNVGFQGEYVTTMPDGRLTLKGCTPSGDCGMFIVGPRGGGAKKISGEPSDTAPSPSPNGSKIAFMSFGRAGNNWEIWVMNADGSDPTRLTEDSSADGLPTWSPDGQTIAFVSNRGGVWAVWAMNPDGSNQRKLFDMKGPPDGKVLHDEFNSRGWLEERISWAP